MRDVELIEVRYYAALASMRGEADCVKALCAYGATRGEDGVEEEGTPMFLQTWLLCSLTYALEEGACTRRRIPWGSRPLTMQQRRANLTTRARTHEL